MGEINCKYKKSKNLYLIKNKIKYPEVINVKLLNAINAGILEHFLPLKASTQKKKGVLTCTVKGLTSLSNYASIAISKEQFLDIVYQLIQIIKQCDNFKINTNNIELHLETIFYEPNLRKIKCIYWPVANNNSYINPQEFFKCLPDYFTISTYDDISFLQKYAVFLNSIRAFSLSNFERLILSMQGKRANTVDISPDSTVLGSSQQLHSGKSSRDIEYDPVKISQEIGKANSTSLITASLIRRSTNESFEINKNTTYIGSSANSDVVISDNLTISRQHAIVIRNNSSFYISDCNSTNHTYLNGRICKPNVKTPLTNNSIITLANEEFTFIIN